MRVSCGAFQPATPRPDADPSEQQLLKSFSPSHTVAAADVVVRSPFKQAEGAGSSAVARDKQDVIPVSPQHQQQLPKKEQLAGAQAAAAGTPRDSMQTPQAPPEPPTALQSRETEPGAHAPVTLAVGSGSGSGGKAKHSKHRPSAVLKLSQQAMKCLQSYEDRLLLELQSILQNSAASTAASAAAGAAVGAGAAVAAAQQALAGRVALVQSGLLSPPDSARSARVKALQEFRRQPGAAVALELQAQMVAQLEAAEAKLHVHRTAATSAKVKIQQLEELVQQLQLRQHEQHGRLSEQQQHTTSHQEHMQQQEARIVQQEAELQQQQALLQQQRQELELKEQQLAEAEAQLQSVKAQLQQHELSQWQQPSAYSSLDEQDLRQQQEQLLQEREENQLVEQQLRWRQEELALQQRLVQQQQEAQQAQLAQMQAEAAGLAQQQELLAAQQQQLEHQARELRLMQQQVEEQKRELAAQQQLLHEQQAVLDDAQLRSDASQRQLSLSASLHDIMSSSAQSATQQAAALASSTASAPPQRPGPVPLLPLHKVSEHGLLQQVAQTLASPSLSPDGFAPLSAMHSAQSTASLGEDGAAAKAAVDRAGSGCSADQYACTTGERGPREAEAAAAVPSWISALSSTPDGSLGSASSQGPLDSSAAAAAVGILPAHDQPAQYPAAAPQQEQERERKLQQPRHLPPHLAACETPSGTDSSSSSNRHQDWQLIVSPSTMPVPSADEADQHASTFRRVLQQLDSANSDKGVAAVNGSTASSMAVQQQPRPGDLARVAHYMEALAADNTVLSCEVFHLQQLLVEQRRSASSSCEAVARRLASEAVKLSWELQQAEMALQLQQAAFDAAAQLSGRRRQQRSAGSSSNSAPAGTAAQAGDSIREADGEEAALTDADDGAAPECQPEQMVVDVDMGAICEAVSDKLSGLLAQHEARVQGLMDRLDEEVEACCNECDDAADAAELEAQLSQFEQVYELMQHKSESGLYQDTEPAAPPPPPPPAAERAPRSAAAPLSAAAAAGPSCASPRHHHAHMLPQPHGPLSPRGSNGLLSSPHSSKPFVTSPSGHVSLLASRRTSAAQPPLSSRRPSSATQQQQQQATAGLLLGSPRASFSPAAGPAVGGALLKRQSRLADLLVRAVGPPSSSNAPSPPPPATAATAATAAGSGAVGQAAGDGRETGEGCGVGRLVQLLRGEAGSPQPSAPKAPGAVVTGSGAGVDVGRQQTEAEQGQRQQEQAGPYTRARGNTCEVLIEVAARLQDAVDSVPGSTAAAAAAAGGSVTAAAVAAALRGDHEQGGCGLNQQQQQEEEEVAVGMQEQGSSWEARAAALQQQASGVVGAPRPVPSPSARLLVQAIFEASMATAGAGAAAVE